MQSVLLSNNALTDESLAALLRALVVRQDVRKLVIANNEIGPRSVEQLLSLLQKPLSQCLHDLKLVGCKTQGPAIMKLLERVRDGNSNLKKLGLVRMQLNAACVGVLIDALPSFPYLVELDLSWNSLFSEGISQLLSALLSIKKL